MRRIALLTVAAAIAAFVATGVAQADPGLHSTLTAVTGKGTGHVLVAPTAEDQGTFAVQVTANINGAAPNTTFAVARAVDLNPDGVCTMATGWLPLGDLTTSPGGAGRPISRCTVARRSCPASASTQYSGRSAPMGPSSAAIASR